MKEFRKILFIKTIVILILAGFTGCVTAKIEYVKEKDFPPKEVYKISTIYLKDGSIIELAGKDVKFMKNYEAMENVLVYDAKGKREIIKLTDIDRVKVEVYENNVLLTVGIIVGSILLAVFLILILTDPFEGMKIG